MREVHKRVATLYGCLKRLNLPKDIIRFICSFALPTPHDLIEHVPLNKLKRYKNIIGNKALVDALCKRHLNIIIAVLNSEDDENRTPSKCAQEKEQHHLVPLLTHDAKSLEKELGTTIRAGYETLFAHAAIEGQ